MMTHSFCLLGSHMWHLRLAEINSMATGSCGIVNRQGDWKDQRESGFCCFLRHRLKSSNGADVSPYTHGLRSKGANGEA